MNKYKYVIALFLILTTLLLGMKMLYQYNNNQWAETIGTIHVEKYPDGHKEYYIEYDAIESTAFDSNGNRITGPIRQFFIEKKPIKQKVRIKYLRKEPIIFEIIDPLKLE